MNYKFYNEDRDARLSIYELIEGVACGTGQEPVQRVIEKLIEKFGLFNKITIDQLVEELKDKKISLNYRGQFQKDLDILDLLIKECLIEESVPDFKSGDYLLIDNAIHQLLFDEYNSDMLFLLDLSNNELSCLCAEGRDFNWSLEFAFNEGSLDGFEKCEIQTIKLKKSKK